MKAKSNKKSITISEIYNESQKETVDEGVEVSGAKVTYSEMGTKGKITGTNTQLNAFVKFWNS